VLAGAGEGGLAGDNDGGLTCPSVGASVGGWDGDVLE
jgi:hypothetical protein